MKFFRIAATVLLIGWMILIFCLSHQTADVSSKTSGGLVETIVSFIYPDFEELSAIEQEEIMATAQFWVRKTAHFSIYAILGGFAFLSFITYKNIPLFARISISGLICLLYSISDEIHQLFIPGRSGEIRDVCIDFAGSMLAIIILLLLSHIKFFRKYIKDGETKLRKKKLMELSQELFNRLDAAENTLKELKSENTELKKQVDALTEENDVLRENQQKSEPLKELENKIISKNLISKETEYGAQVIGQIVVSAAKYCNLLTASSDKTDIKELVNLILGRTEVAKAEILKTVSGEFNFEEKKTYIDAQKSAAEDYFASVMAQMQ